MESFLIAMNIIIYNRKHASMLVRMIIDMDHYRLVVLAPLPAVTHLQLDVSGSRVRSSGSVHLAHQG